MAPYVPPALNGTKKMRSEAVFAFFRSEQVGVARIRSEFKDRRGGCAPICGLCSILDFFIFAHEGARRRTQVHIGAQRPEICAVVCGKAVV